MNNNNSSTSTSSNSNSNIDDNNNNSSSTLRHRSVGHHVGELVSSSPRTGPAAVWVRSATSPSAAAAAGAGAGADADKPQPNSLRYEMFRRITKASVVVSPNGEEHPLTSLWRGRKIVVVFLRNLSCMLCKHQVHQLATIYHKLLNADVHLVAITIGSQAQARAFVKEHGWPAEFYLDKSPDTPFSYKEFGLHRHPDLDQAVADPRVVTAANEAAAAGYTQEDQLSGSWVGDGLQNGGVFVLGPGNACDFAYRSAYAGDHPTLKSILEAALGTEADGVTEFTYPSTTHWLQQLQANTPVAVPPPPTPEELAAAAAAAEDSTDEEEADERRLMTAVSVSLQPITTLATPTVTSNPQVSFVSGSPQVQVSMAGVTLDPVPPLTLSPRVAPASSDSSSTSSTPAASSSPSPVSTSSSSPPLSLPDDLLWILGSALSTLTLLFVFAHFGFDGASPSPLSVAAVVLVTLGSVMTVVWTHRAERQTASSSFSFAPTAHDPRHVSSSSSTVGGAAAVGASCPVMKRSRTLSSGRSQARIGRTTTR